MLNSPPPPAVSAVVNAASYDSTGVAPGAVVVLYGANLGPAKLTVSSPDELGWYPIANSGTVVRFDGVPAALLYTSATQVSAIVPPFAAAERKTVAVTVDRDGQRSAATTLTLRENQPGIFTLNGAGLGLAAAINADGSVNGPNHPASRGSYVSLWATGLGATDPPIYDGIVTSHIGKLLTAATAQIGGQPAEVLYAGPAPGSPGGVMQINLSVPANSATGNAVPVKIQVGAGSTQNGVTLSIR